MEVWSAGFPGLAGNPSWQLGKGIVSNQSVKDSLITNDKLSFVIQHTAQIDAGSSGGALLVASPDEKSGYSLIGINTWKARGRENVNFAIPISAIKTFLANAQENIEIQIADKQKIETLTKELFEARNAENYKKTLPFISESFIFSIPVATFTEMLSTASSVARADARTALRDVEPFLAFRIVIADAIYKKLQRTTPIYGTVKASSDDARLTSTSTIRRKEVEMDWALEDGEWLLINTNLLDKSKNNKGAWQGVDKVRYIGVGQLLDVEAPISFSLVFERQFLKYITGFSEITRGYKFISESIYIDHENISNDTIALPARLFDYWGFNLGLQFQYPISFQSFPIQVIPFVKIPLGAGFGNSDSDGSFAMTFDYGFRPGVRFAYHLGKRDRHIFVDVEYRYNGFLNFDNISSKSAQKLFSNSMFGINLGFAY
jgi:serine protease Do